MRYLGIDFGKKRVGVALSDERGTMAFPKEVLPNDTELLTTLQDYIERESVGAVVVGHSLDRAGKGNAINSAITEFVQDITLACGIPVHLEPEQYTTQEAERLQGRNKNTDASAAAIILNSYLVKLKNTKNI